MAASEFNISAAFLNNFADSTSPLAEITFASPFLLEVDPADKLL